jgi:hypothetical protein
VYTRKVRRHSDTDNVHTIHPAPDAALINTLFPNTVDKWIVDPAQFDYVNDFKTSYRHWVNSLKAQANLYLFQLTDAIYAEFKPGFASQSLPVTALVLDGLSFSIVKDICANLPNTLRKLGLSRLGTESLACVANALRARARSFGIAEIELYCADDISLDMQVILGASPQETDPDLRAVEAITISPTTDLASRYGALTISTPPVLAPRLPAPPMAPQRAASATSSFSTHSHAVICESLSGSGSARNKRRLREMDDHKTIQLYKQLIATINKLQSQILEAESNNCKMKFQLLTLQREVQYYETKIILEQDKRDFLTGENLEAGDTPSEHLEHIKIYDPQPSVDEAYEASSGLSSSNKNLSIATGFPCRQALQPRVVWPQLPIDLAPSASMRSHSDPAVGGHYFVLNSPGANQLPEVEFSKYTLGILANYPEMDRQEILEARINKLNAHLAQIHLQTIKETHHLLITNNKLEELKNELARIVSIEQSYFLADDPIDRLDASAFDALNDTKNSDDTQSICSSSNGSTVPSSIWLSMVNAPNDQHHEEALDTVAPMAPTYQYR